MPMSSFRINREEKQGEREGEEEEVKRHDMCHVNMPMSSFRMNREEK